MNKQLTIKQKNTATSIRGVWKTKSWFGII